MGLAGGSCFDFHATSEHLFIVGTVPNPHLNSSREGFRTGSEKPPQTPVVLCAVYPCKPYHLPATFPLPYSNARRYLTARCDSNQLISGGGSCFDIHATSSSLARYSRAC